MTPTFQTREPAYSYLSEVSISGCRSPTPGWNAGSLELRLTFAHCRVTPV